MVLEADRLGCADEVIVIAAALSIQDPRERPAEKTAQADQLHARFADEDSDFLAYLNLWRYLREQQRELSSNQFRKRCKAEFLHYLRVREWQDLVEQLRQAAQGRRRDAQPQPAEPRARSTARCSPGCSRTSGCKDERGREYLGARGARFAIFPGSALAKKPPSWVMVAELVETSRLWGRTAARIEPEWVEPLADHLVKRTYSEPRWDAQPRVGRGDRARDAVRAADRRRAQGRLRADRPGAVARAVHPPRARRGRLGHAARRSSPRTRGCSRRSRRSSTARGGATSSSTTRRSSTSSTRGSRPTSSPARTSTAGGGTSAAPRPTLLTYTRELLVDERAADAMDPRGWPETWQQGELTLQLTYRFEPGADDDGVTVHVPLRAARRSCAPTASTGSCRRCAPELVTALIRSLPEGAAAPARAGARRRRAVLGGAAAARASRCSTRSRASSSGCAACACRPRRGTSTGCRRTCG